MFTKTFTIERHIEELRAELRATTDAEEGARSRLSWRHAAACRRSRPGKRGNDLTSLARAALVALVSFGLGHPQVR